MKLKQASTLDECEFTHLLSEEAKKALASVPAAWSELYIRAISEASGGKHSLLRRIRMATGITSVCATGICESEVKIPTPTGTIITKIYRPGKATENSSSILYIHGGGWSISDVRTYSGLCSTIAQQIGVPVIVPDFRLSPENPYPAANEDLFFVAKWVFKNAGTLGISSDNIFFSGDSAGGQLAIATTLRLLDSEEKLPSGLILFYPVTTLDESSEHISEAQKQFDKGSLLSGSLFSAMKSTYAPAGTLRNSRYISPLSTSLAGLPRTIILSAECDILCENALQFAKKLEAESVPVEYVCIKGTPHAFMTTPNFSDTTKKTLSIASEFLFRKK